MIPRLRSRRGALAMVFALSVLLIIFLITMANLMTLSVAGSQTEAAVVGTQALYAAEAGVDVMLQTGQAGPLLGSLSIPWEGLPSPDRSGLGSPSHGVGRYAVQRLDGRIVAMGEAPRALGKPLRRVVSVAAGGGDWQELPSAKFPQLAALLDKEAAKR